MTLGERMKRYEAVASGLFCKRSPVIVRVDGRAFHTFTRKSNKPFDEKIMVSMVEGARYLAENMQGFKMGYIQSDEASFLLTDYDSLETQGWFDYENNKIVSLSASRMTVGFNSVYGAPANAEFDARAFNIPREEIANYFVWRAKDWYRNSVQMLAQAHFSQKELHQKKIPDLHELLHTKSINWSNLPNSCKNGTWINKDLSINVDVLPTYDSINKFISTNLNNT